MNRRKFLRNTSLAGLGTALLPSPALAAGEQRRSDLKIVFLSDVHVKPTDIATAGMRNALRKANQLQPDLIINGGDSIMDAMAADKTKVREQWDVWNRIISEENRAPVYHIIGNHDAWGWQVKDEAVKADPMYGKKWVLEELKMPGRYYAFEKKNWKFIVLDTAHENNGGYLARIDEEQFQWLETELKNTSSDQHICIASHIPIVSFCAALFADENQPNGDWRISRALLLTDARKMISLFSNYKNIRCCLSGHIHLQDEVAYKGIRYFCNGAVSGSWWNGDFKGFAPAFAQFHFSKDGSVRREMVLY